jgi:hypothetical protein
MRLIIIAEPIFDDGRANGRGTALIRTYWEGILGTAANGNLNSRSPNLVPEFRELLALG